MVTDKEENELHSYFIETDSPEKAIEEAKNYDKNQLREDFRHLVDDVYKYTTTEKELPLDPKKRYLQQQLDRAVDEAIDSVDYLLRRMKNLKEILKFQRECGNYNSSGEIQGAASSVEVAIGKLTILQEITKVI